MRGARATGGSEWQPRARHCEAEHDEHIGEGYSDGYAIREYREDINGVRSCARSYGQRMIRQAITRCAQDIGVGD